MVQSSISRYNHYKIPKYKKKKYSAHPTHQYYLLEVIMAETKRKRPPSFKLEIPANEEKKNELLQNLQKVREVLVKQLGRPVNNTDIMDALVNAWGKSNDENELEYPKTPGTYINVKKSEVNQDFFLTSVSSVSRLMDVAAIHGNTVAENLKSRR